MSFLTPLYIAGILSIALPILFHLIRRMPRERLPFSSLMFLSLSPPRVTQRSRLENLLLLVLRAVALALLAFAFARPFWRQPIQTDSAGGPAKILAVLVDTSASMRRANLWQQALIRAEQRLRETTPADQVAVFTFDRELRAAVGFDQWLAAPVASRAATALAELRRAAPTWAATELGSALAGVAELVDAQVARSAVQPRPEARIVLISDLQQGSRLRGLAEYEWPDSVRVQVDLLSITMTTNAAIQLATEREDTTPDPRSVRVRISNSADSQRDRFLLRWSDSSKPVEVYAAPGKSRVVQAPPAPAGAASLMVDGDDHDFDNRAYPAPRAAERVELLYVGSETPDDPKQPHYYLQRAFPETGVRPARWISRRPDEPLRVADVAGVRFAVVTSAVDTDAVAALRRWVQGGGTLLAVLTNPQPAPSGDRPPSTGSRPADYAWIGDVLGVEGWSAPEAVVVDYAMLGRIDLSHPLFAPFADARFGDFTKIRFWRHRRVDAARLTGARVLAHFDDGDPAIVECPLGRGAVVLLAAGWQPDDSQLAVSSKFVPLIAGLIDRALGAHSSQRQFCVGDVVPLNRLVDRPRSVRRPDGKEIAVADQSERFADTALPGVYMVTGAATEFRFAVNLDPPESQTAPMPPDDLERVGVRLAATATARKVEADAARRRQMAAAELEARQKIWRWLAVAAVLTLFAETWLAGRLTIRKQVAAESSP